MLAATSAAKAGGTYTITVSKDGFESQKITGVAVTDGGNADFAVVLLPQTGMDSSAAEDIAEVLDTAGTEAAGGESATPAPRAQGTPLALRWSRPRLRRWTATASAERHGGQRGLRRRDHGRGGRRRRVD